MKNHKFLGKFHGNTMRQDRSKSDFIEVSNRKKNLYIIKFFYEKQKTGKVE